MLDPSSLKSYCRFLVEYLVDAGALAAFCSGSKISTSFEKFGLADTTTTGTAATSYMVTTVKRMVKTIGGHSKGIP